MIVPLSYHDSFIKPVLTKAVSEAASSCCQFVPVKSFLVGNDCIWEHASGCCWDINQVVTFCFARSAQTQPARLLSQVCLALQWQAAQCTMPLAISKQADQAVAWWFVSHFFASCASPKTHRHARIARVSRAILSCLCVFGLCNMQNSATRSDTLGHCLRQTGCFCSKLQVLYLFTLVDPVKCQWLPQTNLGSKFKLSYKFTTHSIF